MTLMAHYDAAVQAGHILNSPSQRAVVQRLEHVANCLAVKRPRCLSWLFARPRGLFVFGPVGVGKTYVMDLFYQQLTQVRKLRFHFHHFMQAVDHQLRQLQGMRDPIRKIARDLARSTELLCLDEFLVNDVADAMILGELLQQLLKQGVVLVATANTQPDDLYLDGIHRERFLPAIALIKKNCEVMMLDDHKDHRLGRKLQQNMYLTPLNQATEEILTHEFNCYAQQALSDTVLTIQNRNIAYVKMSQRVIWFDFDVICNLPRSQLDFLEIADRFDTIFVSNIPVIAADDTTHVILFIHFVDVMYDRGIRLIISAAVAAEELYVQGPMLHSFQRTLSRLHEMQSADYLARHPRIV